MTHGGVRLLLMPGCVQEAGSGTLSPGPDQVGLPEGGAEEDGDPLRPDWVGEVDLQLRGQLLLHHHHAVDVLEGCGHSWY